MEKHLLETVEENWDDISFSFQIPIITSLLKPYTFQYQELVAENIKTAMSHGKKIADYEIKKAQREWIKKYGKTLAISTKAEIDTSLFGTIAEAEKNLGTYSFQASESTMNRISGDINQILQEGYEGGKGYKAVEEQLIKKFEGLEGWEANRIARTEIHNAHQSSIYQQYLSEGCEYKKWKTAADERVRSTHSDLHDMITAIDVPFSNGCMYPGDSSGPLSEFINCRCMEVPYYLPPNTMVPEGLEQFTEDQLISGENILPDFAQDIIQGEQDGLDFKFIIKGLEDLYKQYVLGIVAPAVTPKLPKKTSKPKEVKPVEKPKSNLDLLKDMLNDVEKPPKAVKPKVSKPKAVKPKESPKTKPKTENKKGTESKSTTSVEVELRKQLPPDITDDGIKAITEFRNKRVNAKVEYGRILNHKTGGKNSPEFRGSKNKVSIKKSDFTKEYKEMDQTEQLKIMLKGNVDKYRESYIEGKNLMTIHNHPIGGLKPPSHKDILMLMSDTWEKYGVVIARDEIWVSTITKELSTAKQSKIIRDIKKMGDKAVKKTGKIYNDPKYSHLSVDERYTIADKIASGEYAKELLKYAEKTDGLNMIRVVIK